MNLRQRETFLAACPSLPRLADIIGQSRPNRHYEGSTSGDSLYGVKKNSSFHWQPQLSTDKKHRMLGGFRFADQSRDRNVSSRDSSGQEPISWASPDPLLVEELLHRFRPRVVYLLTGACPTVASVCLQMKIPVLVFCGGLSLGWVACAISQCHHVLKYNP